MSIRPSTETSRRMKSQKTRDTQCELKVRAVLHSKGLRYRVDTQPLKGLKRKADIVFRRTQVAVFIDGCFWHGCKKHREPSKTNTEWWTDKILSNQHRDRDTDIRLESEGWIVIRAWEHENPQHVAERVEVAVKGRNNI